MVNNNDVISIDRYNDYNMYIHEYIKRNLYLKKTNLSKYGRYNTYTQCGGN